MTHHCTVKTNSHSLERSGRDREQITYISVSSHCVVGGLTDAVLLCKWYLAKLTVYILLDLILDGSLKLVALTVDDFYTVVIVRVVAG